MRSAAYSLFTTLLLLVPISAVPLMAIFGVPQFTPVVASPLDDADEDAWNRPARKKKSRAAAQTGSDQDIEFPADDSLNWDDEESSPRRPVKKTRPKRKEPEKYADNDGRSAWEEDLSESEPPVRGKKRQTAPLRETDLDEDELIQTVGHDTDEDSPLVETADLSEPTEQENSPSAAPPGGIPSYRRQRPVPNESSEKAANARGKRSAVAPDPLTWKTAVQRLNELGIRNFRLEPGARPGEFTFTCSYTPSNSPHVTRRFEAEADDPLKAVAKVLAQVEDASQQRVLAAPRRVAEQPSRRGVE